MLFRSVTITRSTLSDNSGFAIYDDYQSSGFTIGNTILKASSIYVAPNQSVPPSSLGYNMSDDGGGGLLTGPGDQIYIDALLGVSAGCTLLERPDVNATINNAWKADAALIVVGRRSKAGVAGVNRWTVA